MKAWPRDAKIVAVGAVIAAVASLAGAPFPSRFAPNAAAPPIYTALDAASALATIVVLCGFVAWAVRLWSGDRYSRLQSILVSIALLIGATANWSFEVYARVTLESIPLWSTAADSLWATVASPFATAWLLTPFVCLGWMTALTARRESVRMGLSLFLVGIAIMIYLAFHGHFNSRASLLAKSWTSSALWVGTLPYKDLAVLVVLYLIGYGLGHDRTNRTNDT